MNGFRDICMNKNGNTIVPERIQIKATVMKDVTKTK